VSRINRRELVDHYRNADVEALSRLYFETEGPAARRNHFEDVWHAVGFQASETKSFPLSRALRALGKPDLAYGDQREGMLGWLIHSEQHLVGIVADGAAPSSERSALRPKNRRIDSKGIYSIIAIDINMEVFV